MFKDRKVISLHDGATTVTAPWLAHSCASGPERPSLEGIPTQTEHRPLHTLRRPLQREEWRRYAVVLAFVLLITAFAFQGALHNELVDWDDEPNLVVNIAYRGLAWENIRWMFTTTHGGHYQPLSWLTFAVDYTIWGVNAFGFHLTNLLLHLVTVAGFYFVAVELLRMARVGKRAGVDSSLPGQIGGDKKTGRNSTRISSSGYAPDFVLSLGAGVAALLFAVHPLRVESVAWATERRDVLSGALLMPAVYLYLRGVRSLLATTSTSQSTVGGDSANGPTGASPSQTSTRGRPVAGRDSSFQEQRYTFCLAASLLLYVLSLLAKASAMTLPVVLLLIDVYPLRRLESFRSDVPRGRAGLRRILFEKLLFIVPAMVIAGLAWVAQRTSGAMWSLADHPVSLRVGQACYGVFFYVAKSVWPAGLSPLYQQPPDDYALRPVYLVCAAGVVMFTALAWRLRHRWPSISTAWAAYLVLLLPVLGFVQSGPQLVADRYTYLACMPWAVLVGGWITSLLGGVAAISDPGREPAARRGTRMVIPVAVILMTLALAGLTRSQTRVWSDSYTLWTTVIERRPDTGLAHANLAGILNRRGEFEAARHHARTALEILPGNRTAHLQLAFASSAMGDLETAERHYRTGLQIAQHLGEVDTSTMTSLAFVLARMERWAEAENLLRAVIEAMPHVGQWRFNLGLLLLERGRLSESATSLEEALRLEPRLVEAYLRLSLVYEQLNKPKLAIAALERGLDSAPDDVNLLAELAIVLCRAKDPSLRHPDRAMALARRAVDYSNGLSIRARESLAYAQAAQQEFDSAALTINRLLADERLDISEETRTRLLEELAKFESMRAP